MSSNIVISQSLCIQQFQTCSFWHFQRYHNIMAISSNLVLSVTISQSEKKTELQNHSGVNCEVSSFQ
jgi:hypothetical protein